MRILVDTSILIRTSHRDSVQFGEALDAVDRLIQSEAEACLVPQVCYEYWVVATRPMEQNGLGQSATQASEKLGYLTNEFLFLNDESDIFGHWQNLVSTYQVLGKNAHDARLVAAMLRHGIPAILTLNARHFQRYPMISVFTPETLPENLGEGPS